MSRRRNRNKRAFVSQADIADAVRRIHAELNKVPWSKREYWEVCVTGGASDLPGRLLRPAGASAMFFGNQIPYHPAASWVHTGNPHHDDLPAVSEEAALRLARSARKQAEDAFRAWAAVDSHQTHPKHPGERLDPRNLPPIKAVSVTAALQSPGRRGRDHGQIAYAFADGTASTMEIGFDRDGWADTCTGQGTGNRRRAQNLVLEVAALNGILWFLGKEQIPMRFKNLPGPIYSRQMIFGPDGDTFTFEPRKHMPPLEKLTEESLRLRPFFRADGRRDPLSAIKEMSALTIIPASLNKLTAAHRYMRLVMKAVAPHRLTAFVLNREHPDKLTEPMPLEEVWQRLQACRGHEDVLVRSGGAYFADMAEEFPSSWIVIGHDVFLKLVNPENPRRDADLERILRAQAKIIVFGREGKQMDVKLIPPMFRDVFVDVNDLAADHQDPAWNGVVIKTPNISSTAQGIAMGEREPKA